MTRAWRGLQGFSVAWGGVGMARAWREALRAPDFLFSNPALIRAKFMLLLPVPDPVGSSCGRRSGGAVAGAVVSACARPRRAREGEAAAR
eukprot:gene18636-biopygen895